MRNPLIKRLPKDFLGNLPKYLVMFFIITLTIGFCSGFLVADNSMIVAFDESFEKYNIEDGHITFKKELSDDEMKKLEEDYNIKLYNLWYKEETVGDETYRVFVDRDEVNKVAVVEGRLPESSGEIVIDRLFAKHKNLQVGDTFTILEHIYKVTGFVSFSDCYTFFKNNTDFMFDSTRNTCAIVTKESFQVMRKSHLKYCYAFKFDDETLTDKMKDEIGKRIVAGSLAMGLEVEDYVLEQNNQQIHFARDDMGGDRSIMITLLAIMMVIMAFIFAVTSSSIIDKEALAIGTLRAMGYTRWEMLAYYMALPLLTTVIAAIIGNIMGYTVFKDICADLYYNSYSLPPYKTLWNADAFLVTTVLPFVLMLVINVFVILYKLRLTPLQFLRHDLKKSKKKNAVNLPDLPFMSRFTLRVLGQNLGNYVVMFVGVVFASLLMYFGLMLPNLLDNYKKSAVENMIAPYQLILKYPMETKEESAEKFAAITLKLDRKGSKDEVVVYGVEKDSKFFDLDFSDENAIYVSDNIYDKYQIGHKEAINLQTKYGDEKYSFTGNGTIYYPGGFIIVMEIDRFRQIFNMEMDYYSGYFCENEPSDIDQRYVATKISKSDMTAISDQLTKSIGGMMPMVTAFAFVIYVMIIFILSKIIVENNASSISMVKILGYQNGEIGRLYIVPTAIVIVISLLASIITSYTIIGKIFGLVFLSFSGWIEYKVSGVIFAKLFIYGVIGFFIIMLLQLMNIRKVPMQEALKNNNE